MKKNLFLVALASCFLTFTACSDDNDPVTNTNNAVEQAFDQRYPNTKATWEVEGGYHKADFYEDKNEKEAWFTPAGEWMLTETDISYQQLPVKVRNSFEKSKYAQWKVEDIDQLERPQMETIYVLEVEQGETEYDLVYSEDGILLKEVPDNDNSHHVPSVPSETVVNSIKKMYPDALILEIEKETEGTEVDILDKNVHKEVMFNVKNEWMYTKWEILPLNLPAKVREAIQKLGYDLNNIDDAEVIEYKDGKTYYEVEIERGEFEKDFYFTAEGNEVKAPRF